MLPDRQKNTMPGRAERELVIIEEVSKLEKTSQEDTHFFYRQLHFRS